MRLKHPIFQGPLDPQITLTEVETPGNYRSWPGGKDLPERLAAWQVQTGSFPEEIDVGLVSDPYGFEDSPDAEWISSGVNSKGPTSMALGRHGNFFLWGFSGHPGQMTESGRRVFLNAVAWMKQFDGQKPLIRKEGQSREWALVYVGYLEHYGGEGQEPPEWLAKGLAQEAVAECGYDQAALEAWYRRNMEYLRPMPGGFALDEEVRALGVSNREPAFLETLATRLQADPMDQTARTLVGRYVTESMGRDPAAFLEWYRKNRSHLFFSDVGGFRWRVDERAKAPASTGTR